MALWEEYAASVTPEARFAKAIDKLEAVIQHNEAPISTLADPELKFNLTHGQEQCRDHTFLRQLREAVRQETLRCYADNRIDEARYT